MIYLAIEGRLGNQFFQYAFARALQKRTGDHILYIDYATQKGTDKSGREESLKYYNVQNYMDAKGNEVNKATIIIYKIIKKLKPRNLLLKYIVERISTPFLSLIGIYYIQTDVKFLKTYNAMTNFKFIKGWFESSKYFLEVEQEILEELTPKYKLKNKDQQLVDYLKNTNSICVTVRRGNFTNPELSKRFLVCTSGFYHNGVNKIKEKLKNSLVYVCSDDVEWCKQNLKFEGEVIFERPNLLVWEKLEIMRSCNHFVISNSTFSWWAQHLSKNKNKIVVAPNIWRNEKPAPNSIVEDNWTYVE